jgi:hypothetical protein
MKIISKVQGFLNKIIGSHVLIIPQIAFKRSIYAGLAVIQQPLNTIEPD